MKKILILILLSFTILLGCTKSDLGNSHEDLTSNPSSEVSSYYQTCRARICHTCNQCRGPHYPQCISRCICSDKTGQHTDCAVCGGCIDARIGYVGNLGCVRCDCYIEPQGTRLSCFATAVAYAGKISGLRIMNEAWVIAEFKRASGLDLSNGIHTEKVNFAMEVIFGKSFTNWEEGNRDMRSILDNNEVIITNHPVYVPHGLYGHAIVIVGYASGYNVRYTCLDPATGQYIYMYDDELEWKNSEGNDSVNKFVVSVPSRRW